MGTVTLAMQQQSSKKHKNSSVPKWHFMKSWLDNDGLFIFNWYESFFIVIPKELASPKKKTRWTGHCFGTNSSRLDNIVAWEDFQTWASSAISSLHHYRPTREGMTATMLEGQDCCLTMEKSTWKVIKVIKCNQQASFWTWQSVLFQDVLAIAIPRG